VFVNIKYEDPKMDRTPNVYFFMFRYVSGIAVHVSNTFVGFGEVFYVAPSVLPSENSLLTGDVSGASSRTQGPLDFAPYMSWIVRSVVVITTICTNTLFLTFI